jgi:hypothetical protein
MVKVFCVGNFIAEVASTRAAGDDPFVVPQGARQGKVMGIVI